MPLPAILGVPWLAGLIGGLFSSLFGFFVTYLTKRLAIIAASVTVIVAVTASLFIALEALTSSLTLILPTELTHGISLILPSNINLCLSLMISARMLRFSYDWSIKIIQYKLF